jgi:hypothetical protein
MSKQLCDWSPKDIAKKTDKLRAIILTPRYTCRKCARSANDKTHLCKPLAIHPEHVPVEH